MTFATALSAAVAALPIVARRHHTAAPDSVFDWARLGLATYAASRIVAREKVGSFIREPIQQAARHHEHPHPSADSSRAEQHGANRQPSNGSGTNEQSSFEAAAQQHDSTDDSWAGALADLVTCTRCLGVWNATGLAYLRALAPSHGKLVIDVLSVAGANNFLQAAFSRLAAQANIDEARDEAIHLRLERLEAGGGRDDAATLEAEFSRAGGHPGE